MMDGLLFKSHIKTKGCKLALYVLTYVVCHEDGPHVNIQLTWTQYNDV